MSREQRADKQSGQSQNKKMREGNTLKKMAVLRNYFCRFFHQPAFSCFAICFLLYLNFRSNVPEGRCALQDFAKLEEIYASTSADKKSDINFIISVSFAVLNGRINSVTYGANEGNSVDDALWVFRNFSPKSKFILLEPVPHIFQKLKTNYAGIKSATLVSKAICPEEQSSARLYTIDFSSLNTAEFTMLPSWAKHNGVSSFALEMVKKHQSVLMKRGFQKIKIKEIDVNCTSVNGVIQEHLSESLLDYVQIDVEGFDYNVLRQIELSRWKPLLIKWEHKHLSDDYRQLAEKFVTEAGYYIIRSQTDTLAYRFWSC